MAHQILPIFVAFAEILLVVTAFWITTRREIPQVIRAYRWQSLLLAFATAFIIANKLSKQREKLFGEGLLEQIEYRPASPFGDVIVVVFIAALPLVLAVYIQRILAGATVYESVGLRWIFTPHALKQKNSTISNQAIAVWLKPRYKVSKRVVLLFFSLLMLSFAIVFFGINIKIDTRLGLAVALILHLTGLYNARVRKDVISQMIGILTMDQGMLLAIVKMVNFPTPAILFVLALYFYTGITLLLLFVILPSLRRIHQTIDLDEIATKSELRG